MPSILNSLLLAEYWAAHEGTQQAHQLLERMRLTHVPSAPYIEAATVEAVYKVRAVSMTCQVLLVMHDQSR